MTKSEFSPTRGSVLYSAKTLWVYNGYKWEDTGVTWEQYSSTEVSKEKMTKQEEIREGLVEMLVDELANRQRADWLVHDILLWLNLKGVVLKVERELPKSNAPGGDDHDIAYCQAQEDMLKASYRATIPLIEEQKLDTGRERGV